MRTFLKENPKAVIGMIHCLPLPGTYGFKDNLDVVVNQALHDARTLKEAGFTAIMIENMGDVPYAEKMEVEQIAALSAIAALIKQEVDLPLGVDCAFSDYKSALAIAKAVGASFVRIPVYIDTVIFSDGIIYPSARKALSYREKIKANDVAILADIQVKHSYMLSHEISLKESAKLAESNGADAIVVTGMKTGQPASLDDLKMIKKLVNIPVFVGSGVNQENIKEQLSVVDGCVIGSSIKPGGVIEQQVDIKLSKTIIENSK